MQGVRRRLLQRTAKQGGLLYVAELHGGAAQPKMDHLVCFLPGGALSHACRHHVPSDFIAWGLKGVILSSCKVLQALPL